MSRGKSGKNTEIMSCTCATCGRVVDCFAGLREGAVGAFAQPMLHATGTIIIGTIHDVLSNGHTRVL